MYDFWDTNWVDTFSLFFELQSFIIFFDFVKEHFIWSFAAVKWEAKEEVFRVNVEFRSSWFDLNPGH